MKDLEKFTEDFEGFLKGENRVVIVKGHDDDKKIGAVLSLLNKYYKSGTICTSSLGNIAELINRAFKDKVLPGKINSKSNFKLGKMNISFRKYYDSFIPNIFGENVDYTLFYPVQTALMDKTNYSKLFSFIKSCKSHKIIIVTTNDEFIDTSLLEDYADETIYLEIKNDNPELYSTIQKNLDSTSKELGKNPYY